MSLLITCRILKAITNAVLHVSKYICVYAYNQIDYLNTVIKNINGMPCSVGVRTDIPSVL